MVTAAAAKVEDTPILLGLVIGGLAAIGLWKFQGEKLILKVRSVVIPLAERWCRPAVLGIIYSCLLLCSASTQLSSVSSDQTCVAEGSLRAAFCLCVRKSELL